MMPTGNEIKKELEEISPMLAGLPKSMPYRIPAGYFEQLPQQMLQQATQARVVRMEPFRKFRRLAAVAAAAAVVAVSTWLYVGHRTPTDALALQAVENQMKQVPESEIAAYVDGNDVAASEPFSSGQISGEDMPLVLAGISDEELQQYIDDQNAVKLN